MADGYYLMDITIKRGPYTLEELRQQHISERTRIWSPNLKKWVYAVDLPELQDLFRKKEPFSKRDFVEQQGVSFSAEDKKFEENEQKQMEKTELTIDTPDESFSESSDSILNEEYSETYLELSENQNENNYQSKSESYSGYERKYSAGDSYFQRPAELNKITLTIVWSVIVTIFCCMPMGVVGLILSIIASSKDSNGEYDAALKNLKAARWFTFGGLVISFVFIFIYLLLIFISEY